MRTETLDQFLLLKNYISMSNIIFYENDLEVCVQLRYTYMLEVINLSFMLANSRYYY